MPKFSTRSTTELLSCNIQLQDLFAEVIKHWDCTVLEGHRSAERQREMVRQGKSRAIQSKHTKYPSHAIDVAPFPIEWNNEKRFYAFAGFVLGTAKQMNIAIRWGGDWDSDRDLDDQTFNDLAHFELAS